MSELIEYKCPNCGGSLQLDTKTQEVKCPYCDSTFGIEALQDYDKQLQGVDGEDSFDWRTDSEVYTQEDSEALISYVCSNCGGEIVTDANTAATSCPYCGSPIVVADNVRGSLKPNLVIPFAFDKKQAKQKYLEHLEGKPFLPREFRNENHIDEMKGIYVPFFLFDADVDARMRFIGTRSFSHTEGDYLVTETHYYSLFRSCVIGYDNVPADASSSIDDALMESIEPYDYSKAVDFNSAYLAGFLADRYDKTVEDVEGIANTRISNSAAFSLESSTSGYTNVTPQRSIIRVENGDVKYALLPVWLLNTTYNGQRYTFAMNGQTGKFVGDLPSDKSIAIRYFILIFLGVTLLIFLIQFLAAVIG